MCVLNWFNYSNFSSSSPSDIQAAFWEIYFNNNNNNNYLGKKKKKTCKYDITAMLKCQQSSTKTSVGFFYQLIRNRCILNTQNALHQSANNKISQQFLNIFQGKKKKTLPVTSFYWLDFFTLLLFNVDFFSCRLYIINYNIIFMLFILYFIYVNNKLNYADLHMLAFIS